MRWPVRLFAVTSLLMTASVIVFLMRDPVFAATPARAPYPSAVIVIVGYMVVSSIIAFRCAHLEGER